MKSMTGFGRGSDAGAHWQVSIEMKSVNSRYLEISTRMPKQLVSLEDRIKRLVGEVLSRGRVDIFLVLEEIGEKNHNLKVDKELALAYYNAVQVIADLCELDQTPSLDSILAFSGVLSLEKEERMPTKFGFISPSLCGKLSISCCRCELPKANAWPPISGRDSAS